MFEVPVDKQEAKSKYERIGISVLVILVIAGAVFYFLPKQNLQFSRKRPVAVPCDLLHRGSAAQLSEGSGSHHTNRGKMLPNAVASSAPGDFFSLAHLTPPPWNSNPTAKCPSESL